MVPDETVDAPCARHLLCAIPAVVFGDPHFITFDGLQYSFNGKGEYTLVSWDKEDLQIQGRTEPGNCKRATFKMSKCLPAIKFRSLMFFHASYSVGHQPKCNQTDVYGHAGEQV